jgi:hypothetical protein
MNAFLTSSLRAPLLRGVASALLLAAAASTVQAGHYRLELIRPGTVIDGYTITEMVIDGDHPNINDRGEVVFTARVTGPGGYDDFAVLTNRRIVARVGDVIDGQVITILADEDIGPVINNQGQVAYLATFNGADRWSGTSSIIFDNHIVAQPGMTIGGHVLSAAPEPLAVDDLGRVFFHASTANSAETGVGGGLFSQHGLVWSGGPQQIAGENVLYMTNYVVSRSGEHVAAYAEFENRRSAIVTPDEILVRSGDIRDGLLVSPWPPSYITDDGQVFTSLGWSGNFRTHYVLLPDFFDVGAAIGLSAEMELNSETGIVPVGDGAFAYSWYWDEPAWPDGIAEGLFSGSEMIAASGDRVQGNVVRFFESPLSVNRRGDIAVRVLFDDRSYGIMIATVVPEPSAVVLLVVSIAVLLLWRALSCARLLRSAYQNVRPVLPCRRTFGSFERLECRALLAGFDLADYIVFTPFDPDPEENKRLLRGAGDVNLANISGAAYVADGGTERLFTISNDPTEIWEFRVLSG